MDTATFDLNCILKSRASKFLSLRSKHVEKNKQKWTRVLKQDDDDKDKDNQCGQSVRLRGKERFHGATGARGLVK